MSCNVLAQEIWHGTVPWTAHCNLLSSLLQRRIRYCKPTLSVFMTLFIIIYEILNGKIPWLQNLILIHNSYNSISNFQPIIYPFQDFFSLWQSNFISLWAFGEELSWTDFYNTTGVNPILKIRRGLLHMNKRVWLPMRRWNTSRSKRLIKYYLHSKCSGNPGQNYGRLWDIYTLH